MDIAFGWADHVRAHARIVAAASFLWTVGFGIYLYFRRRTWAPKGQSQGDDLPLPPGPKPLPIIGNILDMAQEKDWETLTEWAEKYGDIVHVKVFGRHMIYLNSYRVASDLMEKRGSIYSDRPRLPLVNELMGLDWNLALVHYGDYWRKYRRAFVSRFGGTGMQMFNQNHEKATALLLKRLLDSPEDFIEHLRLHSGQLIMLCVYGKFVDSIQHPYIQTAEAVNEHFSEAARPGAWLVDALPILKRLPTWFPGTYYQRVAAQWAEDVRTVRFVPFRACKDKLANGKASPFPCFVADMLQKNDDVDKETESIIQDCSAVAYAAGSDTTVAALTSFILAMVLYPGAQKQAQDEIARVIGTSRLPTMKDRENLPYIAAVVKETLRWHTVGPQALPHRLMEDDVYNGYYLPKGSLIIGNVWRMAHDPNTYPDPLNFKPERFLNLEGKVDCGALDPLKYAFGFGRRLCAGHHFAESTIYFVIAQTLQCFNITNAKDGAGNPISVSLNPTTGMISHPEPFRCSITARSDQAAELIRQAAADALFTLEATQ